jgi:hypothetical protein
MNHVLLTMYMRQTINHETKKISHLTIIAIALFPEYGINNLHIYEICAYPAQDLSLF